METSGLPLLTTILIIVAVPALIGLLAYAATGWFGSQSRALAQQIDNDLLDLTERHDQLRGFLQNYRGVDREPFFTHLDALQTEAAQLDNLLEAQLEDFRVFVNDLQAQQESTTPQQKLLSPISQFRLWSRARRLRAAGKNLAGQIDTSEQRVEVIYALPWDLALECRKADEETAELEQKIQWLQAKNVRGVALQKVASQLPILQQGLAKIPDLFFDADRETLLKTVRLDVALKTFDALQSVRPALDRYLPPVRGWRASLEKLTVEYTDLKNAGAALRQTVANPPAGLSVTSLQARLDQVAQRAAEINQQLTQPEAEALKGLAREVHLLRQTLRATEEQFRQAAVQMAELQKAIGELHSLRDATLTQRQAVEHGDIFPLVWDRTGAQFDALRKEIDALGSLRQQRTPEQIQEQQKSVESLRAQLKEIAGTTPQTIAQYHALVQLLNSSDLQEGSAWLRQTRGVLDQAAGYDSKNWQRSESINTLPAEMEELAAAQERLVPSNRALALKESNLETRLAETKALAAQHKAIRARITAISTRLGQLQAFENQSKDNLDAAWSMLERMSILIENNDLLHELAAEDVERLTDELRQTSNELKARGQGEIERKANRSQSFTRKVRATLDRVLEQLGAALSEQYTIIDAQLNEVDAIARLESRAVEDARGFLNLAQADLQSRPAAASPQSVVGKVTSRFQLSESKPAQSDVEALAELKRKNDLWLTLLGYQDQMESQIQPVLEAYQEAAQARDEARDLLLEAQKRFSTDRSWPPSNQPALSENTIFGAIQEKWATLRQKRVQPNWVVQELQRITEQYHVAAERVHNIIDRIEEDQKRIQDQEWQIEMLKQRWLSQSDPTRPVVREGVKTIISETDARLAGIRQKYLAGELSYEQSLQQLRELYDTVSSREITIDENTRIGLKDSPHRRTEKA